MASTATLQRDKRDGRSNAPSGRGMGAVMADLAGLVASAGSLQALLRRAMPLMLEAVPAERCSLFLAGADTATLEPAFAVGLRPNRELWRRFRAIEPVDLRAVPARLRLFRSGRVAPVADLSRSAIAPVGLPGSFGVGSALLAPMVARGEPLGLLVFDWSKPGRLFRAAEREAAAAVAAVLAVGIERLTEEPSGAAGRLQEVARLAAALGAATSVGEVVDLVAGACKRILGVRVECVELAPGALPGRDKKPIVWRPRPSRSAMPSAASTQAGEHERTVGPGAVPSSSGSTVLFPLRMGSRHIGNLVCSDASLTAAEVETAEALADLAAAAVARVEAEEALRLRLHQAEALCRLSDVVAGTGGITAALRELNRTLPPELGIRLRAICVSNAQLRATVDARPPEPAELEAIRSWRSVLGKGRSPLRPKMLPGGAVLVPLAHRSRVHGALRVTVAGDRERDPAVDDVLLALGAGCAEVVHRAALQRHLGDSERRLAVAAERERIAQDLHDSVGQIVTGMGMRLAQYVVEAPDKVWRARLEELLHLAGRGNREIRQAIHALLFLEAQRDGLAASVRELVRKYEVTTGLPVRFVLRGTHAPLPPAKEGALFRAAHEALMNVERHSRASLATVQLTYSDDAVVLMVRDDGVGLGHRDPFGSGGAHFGIRGMQQRLEAAGGELRVRNARPRGVVVEARVSRRTKNGRSPDATGSRRRG